MIPLSKTMRLTDFGELTEELTMVDHVLEMLSGGDKAQHPLRRWEYAMALLAFKAKFGEVRDGLPPLKVADHGCCTGMFAPMMLWLGCKVRMYEVWAWGNQEEYALQQMEIAKAAGAAKFGPGWAGNYRMIHRPLSGLTKEDRGVDAAYCISTMEHIPNYEEAFRDMCRTVKPEGMLFMTSDSAESENDHYIAANVRGGRMFNRDVYTRLVGWGREEGFELLGGLADWGWDESCRLLPTASAGPNGYGFASLAMEKVRCVVP